MVSGCKSRKIFRSYGTLFCIISTKGTYVPSCNISSLRDFVVEKFYFISDGVKVRSSGVEVRSSGVKVRSGEVETGGNAFFDFAQNDVGDYAQNDNFM